MLKTSIALIAGALILSGCSSSVSWSELEKHQSDANYCSSAFVESQQIESCEIEQIAYQRAKDQCQYDSNPEYCEIMARHGWRNFKEIILSVEPTKEHARIYPVICGFKEHDLRPCSQ
ncbi:hypothetical protein ACFSJQ_21825 [Vibrio olivae]|uniref:Lipoprotein n=1 Tax=Vibrio olivae TaxID=1243002 RepID=A0ABV5HPC3_9VIBR